ncbi:MAG: hypothetical protein OEV49_13995 [candidate division Zixibacteria bacterium]|nr:hypothetical protein [candidate division Zixibacteria bacterium]MDH3938897.1 hypothetical protein [candidate division Zixibacteria bacterium]MDH4035341.1 hypothetical protein [candidate division Zixibacteria bacterium]
MSGWEIFEIWVIAFFTLSLFSFMYKDNPLYKVAEHIFAGLSAGYYVGLIWDTVIVTQLWVPMVGGKWLLIFPGILGFLMFARFFPKYSWVSRTSLAFVMGVTAGIFIVSQLHGLVLPQMQATMQSLGGGGGLETALLAIIVAVGVISTLIYFYFSKEHVGVLGVTAKVGIWFIMISFGAHFGYTVMGRVSLLIGRVQFLSEDWIGSFSYLF